MSDFIKHECGIALIRLLKPLEYYREKYGDIHYGLSKMYLLMEKQHNRGQDGAGIATIKLDTKPGAPYFDRERSIAKDAIKVIFNKAFSQFNNLSESEKKAIQNMDYVKQHYPFMGELLMGHLRYGTHGGNDTSNCHPRVRANNWKTRTLIVAGNFNMTNVDELFEKLVSLGQFPREASDTITVLEKIGHFLDSENQKLFRTYKSERNLQNVDITPLIAQNMNVEKILKNATEDFDGGYAMAGMIGHGDAFALRDPNGIRPAFYYKDEEVVVVASERPAIITTFNVHRSKIQELQPGHALIIKKDGSVGEVLCSKPREKKSCSFERIYFSRGNDFEIYQERKNLGKLLVDNILHRINYNLKDTVFSYIPNTAEVAFLGMVEEVQKKHIEYNLDLYNRNTIDFEQLQTNLKIMPRVEKIAVKDVKLRTFITDDSSRNDMVHHVYDVTYGLVTNNVDTLVVIDDSVVRGTTLKESILTMLDRLQPKKVIIVSSAPQIRYPDCYGIDMSKMGSFVAFQAAINLWKKSNKFNEVHAIYKKCIEELEKPATEMQNLVKEVYAPFSYEQVSNEIAEIVRPQHIFADIEVIYQSIENLHIACPKNLGDWYFTGDYPTPGGNKVALKAFVNYMEGKNVRAY
ncbi:MAG: amidophosphoribosyltransferase [Bacteroidetes bacterium]|nr:amidophosphoribosyltransferase [Bacteroidota bacterium]